MKISGGTTLGNCAIGNPAMVTSPTITMMIEITIATIGRLMKNLDIVSAGRDQVAQVSNLPYRSASSLPGPCGCEAICVFEDVADWKSAIQQVGNLRYRAGGLFAIWRHFAAGFAA